jgi:hypothetical protein
MSSFSLIAKAALLAAVLATPAAAAVVVPGSGTTNYEFDWFGGLGQIDGIDLTFEDTWSLTLATASTVSFTATDDFVVGDAFELLLDGLITPWTTTGITSGGFFQGTFLAPLTAGSYLFSLQVSQLAIDTANGAPFRTGGALASFSVTPTVVPLPAGGILLIGALGMLAALRRRKSV